MAINITRVNINGGGKDKNQIADKVKSILKQNLALTLTDGQTADITVNLNITIKEK